jgi:hypothetical protein
MFLDEISIQTSILMYAGLGFIFFLGFGYYFFRNPIKNGHSLTWKIILGSIRGLILASLLIAIFPFKIFENLNSQEPVEFIFVVDFPELANKDFNQAFKKVDSIVKIKHPEVVWIDFKGQSVINLKKSLSNSRSLNQLNQTIRKLNKGRSSKEIFILTDGNLTDLNIELASNIHLIPYGKILNKEQVEFSTTHLPLVSVPNEEVHLPIEVWLANFKQNKNVIIDVYVDGVFFKKQKVSFDSDHTYVITDVAVKSPKLGKHQIKVILDNGLSTLIDWNVVNEKAIVYGFSDALDPDVGVLNRIAKNKFIKLIWNFDVQASFPEQANKFIFLRILPKDIYKNKVLVSPVLFLNTSKDKVDVYLDRKKRNNHKIIVGEALWDLQMKEFQSQGSYAQTDSTIGAWFEDLFITNNPLIDSLNKNVGPAEDLLMEDISPLSLGRNDPKLNFLAQRNNIDLLEIDELANADFVPKGLNSNFKQDSVFIWQNIYFKLWVLFLILAEWIIRKFKELR